MMIIANDATVKAGAFFPATAKKVLRAQRIAVQNRLPLVYLVDSAGVFLPLQEDVFPDEDDFGRIFRNNAVISAIGLAANRRDHGQLRRRRRVLARAVRQAADDRRIGLVSGRPGAGEKRDRPGGFTRRAGRRGDARPGERHDRLSRPERRSVPGTTATAGSGRAARRFATPAAISTQLVRGRVYQSSRVSPRLGFASRRDATTFCERGHRPAADLYKILTANPGGEYEVRDVLNCLLDAGTFDEYKPEYGQTLVCGTAELGGFAIGIVANQRHRVRPADGPFQFGGVLYVDSAEKAARFVMNCNQDWLPILFLQDVNGFMVGRDAERSGIIKAGAKLVSAISNSRVPKITVITGGSYGAGNYALCGKAFDPRFIFAWPTAHVAVMGADQAADTLLDVAVKSLQRQGENVDAAELEKLRETVTADYLRQTDVRYAAARGWVDAILDPATTRESLILALEVATRHAEPEPFRLGVFQV